jgi:hypothetical protein
MKHRISFVKEGTKDTLTRIWGRNEAIEIK